MQGSREIAAEERPESGFGDVGQSVLAKGLDVFGEGLLDVLGRFLHRQPVPTHH